MNHSLPPPVSPSVPIASKQPRGMINYSLSCMIV